MELETISEKDIMSWLSYLEYNYSKMTVKTYADGLFSYLEFVINKVGRKVYPNWRLLMEWINHLREEGRKETTIDTYLKAMKNFLTFYDKEDVFKELKKRGISPKPKRKLPVVIEPEQVKRMEELAGSLRNKLIVRLLFVAGLRVSELVNLKTSDFLANDNAIRVRVLKKRKGEVEEYVQALDSKTVKLMKEWIRVKEYSKWLFPSSRNPDKHITARAVRFIIKDLGREIGVDIHPHTLRHSLATLLARRRVPIQHIAKALRHSSTRTTEIYVHLAESDVKEIIKENIEGVI